MKTFFLIILTGVSFIVVGQDLAQVDDFGPNKGNLKMYHYVSSNLSPEQKVPLVLVLHGCTQSAQLIANETGWNKLADSLHFMVVYPEQKQINNVTKCFNFFIGFKAKKDKGEVASIRQMMDYCFEHYLIDSTQVFITGMSAGGGMSNAMLNLYPELFNAGALIGAPSTLMGTNKSKLTQQPRIAILQGDKDLVVSKNHAEKNLRHWLEKHEMTEDNKTEQENYQGNEQLTAQFYTYENKQAKVVLLLAKGVAHKVLIDPGEEISKGGEMDFHTEDIDFHSTYWIADFFGLVK